MGRTDEQREAIDQTLEAAEPDDLRRVLEGTIGDARSFVWGALDQYEARRIDNGKVGRRMFGARHVAQHVLLVLAHEAVCHAECVEQVRRALGEPISLPPDQDTTQAIAGGPQSARIAS